MESAPRNRHQAPAPGAGKVMLDRRSSALLANLFSTALTRTGVPRAMVAIPTNSPNPTVQALSALLRLFDQGPAAMGLLDEHGLILSVNAVLGRMLGYEQDDLSRLGIEDLACGPEVEEMRSSLSRLRNGEPTSFSVELLLRRKDGDRVCVAATFSALTDSDGNHYALAMFDDLTHRRLSEETIRHLRTVMEAQVAERTAELSRSLAEMESFSYTVAHELRAPARALDSFAQVLARQHANELSAAAHDYLMELRQNARQMDLLVSDLLTLARAANHPVSMLPTAIEPIVREAIRSLHAEIGGRKVEIKIGQLPQCHCDPIIARHVVVNLLSNAIKFTRMRRDALIEIGFWEEREGPVFFVRDNGIGFDMAACGDLFKAFHRLHSSNDYEGTGVGLAIVHRMLQRHGGRIWYEAEPDRGACFYFTFSGGSTGS